MTNLGISVYLSDYLEDPEKVYNYLSQAKKCGFCDVFSSIHLPEDDFDAVTSTMIEFSNFINSNGFSLSIDLSSMDLLKIKSNPKLEHDFQNSRILLYRLDFGFNDEDIRYIYNFLGCAGFMINASTTKQYEIDEYLNDFYKLSPDIVIKGCHNFYPRPETGLGMKFLIDQSTLFKNRNINTIACVASYNNPRGPIFKGLPTAECHRFSDIGRATQELLSTGVINEILIGDPFALKSELEAVFHASETNILSLRFIEEACISQSERNIIYYQIHIARPDLSDFVIRSRSSREMANFGKKISPNNTNDRSNYSVTIDNANYNRYSGELQIVLKDLPADNKVNVVGKIFFEDIRLLDYVKNGVKFRFEKYNEDAS